MPLSYIASVKIPGLAQQCHAKEQAHCNILPDFTVLFPGRAEYQYINVLGTGAFPALVAVCFAILIGQTFRRAGLPHEWNLLPLVYLAVATAENLGIAYLLYTYPAVQPNAAGIVGIFASFKFRLLTYNALSVVLGFAWLMKTAIQKRFAKKRN